jgi:hypothetical protein
MKRHGPEMGSSRERHHGAAAASGCGPHVAAVAQVRQDPPGSTQPGDLAAGSALVFGQAAERSAQRAWLNLPHVSKRLSELGSSGAEGSRGRREFGPRGSCPDGRPRLLGSTREPLARRLVEHFEVHASGETWADVTEGNPWPIRFVWESLRYDWSEAGAVRGRVIESNIFKPGSTWEIHATPLDSGGSRVEIFAVRHLRGVKGLLLAPLFPLGLARRDVADYLRRFLSEVEAGEREANPVHRLQRPACSSRNRITRGFTSRRCTESAVLTRAGKTRTAGGARADVWGDARSPKGCGPVAPPARHLSRPRAVAQRDESVGRARGSGPRRSSAAGSAATLCHSLIARAEDGVRVREPERHLARQEPGESEDARTQQRISTGGEPTKGGTSCGP